MKANNEERENCGVFHVKDTHISIHIYVSFEKTLCASLLCDYVRKRTQKRQRFCSPLTKATRRQNRSLSLFVCLFVSLFVSLFAYSRVGRPVELLNSQEEEEESQSESESKTSSSQGGHLFSYKYCKQSE